MIDVISIAGWKGNIYVKSLNAFQRSWVFMWGSVIKNEGEIHFLCTSNMLWKKKYDCTVTKSASNNDLLCVVNFNWENQLAERDEIVQTNQIDGAPNL